METFRSYPVVRLGKHVTVTIFALLKESLERVYEVSNSFANPIHMSYKMDFRGRIYPHFRIISHTSHAFLRPMFSLNEFVEREDIDDIAAKERLEYSVSGKSELF